MKAALLGGAAALAVTSLVVLALGAVAVTVVAPNPRSAAAASGRESRAGSLTPALAATYRAAAATYCPQLPWRLLAGQGRVESHYNPAARSPVGARGIAQFMPGTWATWGLDGNGDGRADITNPADAIPTQAHYDCALLAGVADLPGDPIHLMLAAYNAGPGAVRRYRRVPPYAETRAYITAVLDAALALETTDPQENT